MMQSHATWKWALILILAAGLCAANGCSYAQHRAEDAAEMVDLGVSISLKPQFEAYANFFSLPCLGYGNVDGYFVGIGGGHIGFQRRSSQTWGLLVWGHESFGWGEFDRENPSTLYRQTVGLLGMPAGLAFDSNPNYVPT